MAPRTEKEFEKIRQDKKELIKQTAMELFAEKGYHNTSISLIAQKTSISKGLLYNYFTNKEQLLLDIIEDIFRYYTVTFSEDVNKKEDYTKEAFFDYINYIFEELKSSTNKLKFYYAIYFQKEVEQIIKKYEKVFFERIYSMLIKYFQNMNCENPEEEMIYFSTIIEGTALEYVYMPDYFPLEVIKKKIIEYYKMKF